MKDEFALACEQPGARTELIEIPISKLWRGRFRHIPRYKNKRRKFFFDAFPEFVLNVISGNIKFEGTKYWEYIRRYRHHWIEDPNSEQTKREMTNRLLKDVEHIKSMQQNGMLNPMELIVSKEGYCLYRGATRLVILKVLGVKTAKVRVVYV